MKLTKEQLLIAFLRVIPGDCQVSVSVQDGRPCRITCTGGWIDRAFQVEIPEQVDAYTRELTANERHLLSLCEEACYGRIAVILKAGRIEAVGVAEWSRRLDDVRLTEEGTSFGTFMRRLLAGGREDHGSSV